MQWPNWRDPFARYLSAIMFGVVILALALAALSIWLWPVQPVVN